MKEGRTLDLFEFQKTLYYFYPMTACLIGDTEVILDLSLNSSEVLFLNVFYLFWLIFFLIICVAILQGVLLQIPLKCSLSPCMCLNTAEPGYWCAVFLWTVVWVFIGVTEGHWALEAWFSCLNFLYATQGDWDFFMSDMTQHLEEACASPERWLEARWEFSMALDLEVRAETWGYVSGSET